MAQLAVSGATCMCSFGTTPSTLNVLPANMVSASSPAATIMDNVPFTNITPFGMCNSLANPQVSAATAAAQGVLTPQPCIPVIPGPWVPGSPTVLIKNQPALHSGCTCMCTWAGVISISFPGQATVNVP